MAKREHNLKIGVSGIRGVVGEFLTPGLSAAFAQAFGTYVGPGRVVVGRDTRVSGEMLFHAVACGLLAAGCEVLDVGILPTPTIQMFVSDARARGGLALTASHNPQEYNALKLFNARGQFFNQYEREELIHLYHQSSFHQATNAEIARVTHDYDSPPERHFARVLAHVDAPRIQARHFRVALDGVNGAGSKMSVRFLREILHADLHAISVSPGEPFPREAEPRPEVLGELQRLVGEQNCDIGFAQDPDGDRLAIVDETGAVLDNDDVLALVVDAVLAHQPGNVVVNLTTSSVIEYIAAQHSCRVFRTPVGEANVVEGMQHRNAVIGGEGANGGIIFPAVHFCRDSYTGMAFVLDRMAATGETVSQLRACFPSYHRRHGKVAFEHGTLGPLMQALEEGFPGAGADRRDGLKLLLSDAWLHVRASNTEPLLRVAVESLSAARADELYQHVMTLFAARG